jgi:hypothetical protein
MPKWSEVPWGTVVTAAVALYGEVLSTFNFLRAGGSSLRRERHMRPPVRARDSLVKGMGVNVKILIQLTELDEIEPMVSI